MQGPVYTLSGSTVILLPGDKRTDLYLIFGPLLVCVGFSWELHKLRSKYMQLKFCLFKINIILVDVLLICIVYFGGSVCIMLGLLKILLVNTLYNLASFYCLIEDWKKDMLHNNKGIDLKLIHRHMGLLSCQIFFYIWNVFIM